MNAMAGQLIGQQAANGQLTAETSSLTVYPKIPILYTGNVVNFVDLPGLQDTEGRDQEILVEMKETMKTKCPEINLFVLCFERGPLD